METCRRAIVISIDPLFGNVNREPLDKKKFKKNVLFVCIIMNGNCFMRSMAKMTQMVGGPLFGSVLTVINSYISVRFHYSFHLRGGRLGTSLRDAVDAEIDVLSAGNPCRALR